MKSPKPPHRFAFERSLWEIGITRVAGVDEAGCGPLAGPVVAAAVVFPCAWRQTGLLAELRGLNDSKQLTEVQRENFFRVLTTHPEIGFAVGRVEADLIDQLNILQAAHRAMNLALAQLRPPPEHVLVDGRPVRSLRFPHTPIIKGDSRSYTIAAASVIAKVTRDRLMREYDQIYPAYGFATHKGYATPQHRAQLQLHGPCPIHRQTFLPAKHVQPELLGCGEFVEPIRRAAGKREGTVLFSPGSGA